MLNVTHFVVTESRRHGLKNGTTAVGQPALLHHQLLNSNIEPPCIVLRLAPTIQSVMQVVVHDFRQSSGSNTKV